MGACKVIPLVGIDQRSTSAPRRLDLETLRSKLGHTAFHVWSILLELRRYHGDGSNQVHPTTAGIGRMKGYVRTHPRAVKKALAKLRAAGLVRDLGWERREVPVGRNGRTAKRKVYVREVFGYLEQPDRRGDRQVVVPAETELWAEEASTWGGAREGAGRPSMKAENQVGPMAKESSGSPKGNSYSEDRDINHEPDSLRSSGARAHAREDEHPSDGPNVETPAEVGSVIGGSPPTSVVGSFGSASEEVPPYPGISVIAPAKVPEPPLLKKDTPAKMVGRMIAAYQGVYRKLTGEQSFAFKMTMAERSKLFPRLAAAAKALVDHEVAPTSWALWSFDVWKRYDLGRKGVSVPPIGWVFSAERIIGKRGWFRKESRAFKGGRAFFGPEHKALLGDWMRMHVDVSRREPGEHISDIVAKHFPKRGARSYHSRVERVEREVSEYRTIIRKQINEGVMLWG